MEKKVYLFLILHIIGIVGTVNADTETLVVTLPYGKIRGHEVKSAYGTVYYGFQEIPYAAPPIGKLRFKDPVPPQNWDGILDATRNTKVCYQKPGAGSAVNTTQTEDCLYLNIYTPIKPTSESERLPVLLWIHGGGFTWGDGTYQSIGAGYFMDHDIIVVSINYRLGAFGFLTTADGVIPANLGLKDQTAAIEWTHSNIHLFGGDPDKITIVGESTGATAVGLQVLIKKADGLFRGAIIESGTVLCESTPQNYPRYYAYQMGSALDPTFSENNSSEELLELLQNASADDIRNHSNMTIPLGMENKIGPHRGQIWTAVIEDENIIDDAFLVGLFHENVKDGKINNVTTMIGYNSEEELHFLNDYANWTESFLELAIYFDEDTSRLIHNKFNMTDENKVMAGSRLRKIYTEGRFQDNLTALVKYFTDDVFSTPIVRQVTLQSSYSDIYLYQFSYKGLLGGGTIEIEDGDNVGHGEDLMYMWDFHNVDISTMPESDILMHKRMLKMWTNFVKYLNPTPEEDELLENTIWPKASPDNVTYLNINATLTVGRDPKRYKLWHPIIDEYAIPPLVTY